MTIFPPSSFDEALREHIMREDRAASGTTYRVPDISGSRIFAAFHKLMVVAYKVLTIINNGLAPIPDVLLGMGRVGAWIWRITCQHAASGPRSGGAWRADSTRSPCPTLTVEGKHALKSYAERLVLRAILSLQGVREPAVHPPLPGSKSVADFLVTSAATGQSVYVEVVGMLNAAASTDRDSHCAGYRTRLLDKLQTYRDLGLDLPIRIFIDDLAPYALAQKLGEICDRLGLPLSPTPSSEWPDIHLLGGLI